MNQRIHELPKFFWAWIAQLNFIQQNCHVCSPVSNLSPNNGNVRQSDSFADPPVTIDATQGVCPEILELNS